MLGLVILVKLESWKNSGLAVYGTPLNKLNSSIKQVAINSKSKTEHE